MKLGDKIFWTAEIILGGYNSVSLCVKEIKFNELQRKGTIVRSVRVQGRDYVINLPVERYIESKAQLHLSDSRSHFREVTAVEEPVLEKILLDFKIPTENQESDAQTILNFVHGLTYVKHVVEYTKTPLETLAEGCGDCKDLSVLTYSLMRKAGLDVVYTKIPPSEDRTGHVLVGVAGNFSGKCVEYLGNSYFLAETTGTDFPNKPVTWKIGELSDYDWKTRNDLIVFKAER